MISFFFKHEMKHIAVPYTFDLILLDFAKYPLGERDSERRKDRTVIVYLALLRPAMEALRVGVEHLPSPHNWRVGISQAELMGLMP
jgi:hypothetical protein